jgi:hypothetical protein
VSGNYAAKYVVEEEKRVMHVFNRLEREETSVAPSEAGGRSLMSGGMSAIERNTVVSGMTAAAQSCGDFYKSPQLKDLYNLTREGEDRKLRVWEERDDILYKINESLVTVISGQTG